jgi:hypothetical protein
MVGRVVGVESRAMGTGSTFSPPKGNSEGETNTTEQPITVSTVNASIIIVSIFHVWLLMALDFLFDFATGLSPCLCFRRIAKI